MGLNNLEDFFNQKKEQKGEEIKINWKDRKSEWNEAIEGLYELIERWLKPFEEKGHLKVSYKNITIQEEYLGQYEVRKMIVNFYDEQVIFQPIGTLIIAAHGRIDMIGKNGTIKFLYVNKDSDAPKITVSIAGIDNGKKDLPIDYDRILTWKIATGAPNIRYIPLNEDTFSDVFLAVVR